MKEEKKLYDNIKDDIRDDIYQRSIKYVHIPTKDTI